MSYLRSRTRKHDKKSIQLRKEFEQLSQKSRDEFKYMEKDVRTELLLREGLSKPRKSFQKHKVFMGPGQELSQGQEQTSHKTDELLCEDDSKYGTADYPENNCRNQQPSPLASVKENATVEKKRREKVNLKSIPDLNEKIVTSIQAENAQVDLIMQGRKILKRVDGNNTDLTTNKDQMFDSADLDYVQLLSQFPVSVSGCGQPAMFAITGSQNTSMPIMLTPRRITTSAKSNDSCIQADNHSLFSWSPEKDDGENALLFAIVNEGSENDETRERLSYLESKPDTAENAIKESTGIKLYGEYNEAEQEAASTKLYGEYNETEHEAASTKLYGEYNRAEQEAAGTKLYGEYNEAEQEAAGTKVYGGYNRAEHEAASIKLYGEYNEAEHEAASTKLYGEYNEAEQEAASIKVYGGYNEAEQEAASIKVYGEYDEAEQEAASTKLYGEYNGAEQEAASTKVYGGYNEAEQEAAGTKVYGGYNRAEQEAAGTKVYGGYNRAEQEAASTKVYGGYNEAQNTLKRTTSEDIDVLSRKLEKKCDISDLQINDFKTDTSEIPQVSTEEENHKETLKEGDQDTIVSLDQVSIQENLQTFCKDRQRIMKLKPDKKDKDIKDDSEMDIEEALQKLSLPLEVTASDIVNVSGKKVAIIQRSTDQTNNDILPRARETVKYVSMWDENQLPVKRRHSPVKNIHHFCSKSAFVELPADLSRISRDVHTVDRHKAIAQRYQTSQKIIPASPGMYCFSEQSLHCSEIYAGVGEEQHGQIGTEEYLFQKKLSDVAEGILKNVTNEEEIFKKLQDTANKMFSGTLDESLNIQGMKLGLKDDSTRFYWNAAPPKLHLTPSYIRNEIVPAYQGAPVVKDTVVTEYGTVDTKNEESEDEEVNLDKINPEDLAAQERVLQRQHGSLSNIMDKLSRRSSKKAPEGERRSSEVVEKEALDGSEEGQGERFVSVLDVRRQMARIKESLRVDETASKTDFDSELFTDLNLTRRAQSQPDLTNEVSLCVSSDYTTSMNELEEQTHFISTMKLRKEGPELNDKTASPKEEISEDKSDIFDSLYSAVGTGLSIPLESCVDNKEVVTETNSIITSNSRTVVSRPGKLLRKIQIKTRKDLLSEEEKLLRKKKRQKEIQEFLDQPATRHIKRSESLNVICSERVISPSFSLPSFFNYQSLNSQNLSESDLFDWVQDEYWYQWLDEVYPPSIPAIDIFRDMQSSMSAEEKTRVTPDILDEVEIVKPHVDDASKQLYEGLEKEAEKISLWIEETKNEETLALYLSRRGAIYRKLGLLKKAWDDLERSIQLEPQLLDSYWHRHLLFLLKDQPKKALEDLTFIIKKNRKLVKVYRSMAEIYKQLDDSTMAILNYSQAIKLQPNDAEIYYRRAAMFENRGDTILALEDYNIAAKLLPSRTEAIFNIGRHNFNQKKWQSAIINFTNMLKQDPLDATAYLYRGKANAEQGLYDMALKDLSCALHLSPRNTEAFYHRGCLLRKIHPQKAIQDLSVSLLLDNTIENVNAYLHRAIIYTDLKRWDEAINDFESALQLDKCIASAHVNIGLICITKYQNYPRAVKKYTSAIRVDPTYIRGYICRAEANEKVGNLKESVYDYTKAIHLTPDNSDYRMSRGKIFLKQNKLDLASFQIRQAAELSQGLGGSRTQQAAVHAFLKNYDQAVDILTRATRINPSAHMFILLGKTCMKAKQFENAIASFKRAIFVLTPWHPRVEMPRSAASVYFMIGTCYTELDDLVNALDAFNNAIKIDPDDAQAYYQRGLTKMKLRQAKSIHDFNRALAINPKLFQAFLSRAAYYGLKGRFSKGIMNCNEAIKLQPRSVRGYLYRGALKFHISAYKLAVRDLTEAVAIDCTCSLAYFNRAVCYQAMKFYQKALIDYSTVLLTSKENDLKVLQNRGLLYLEMNDIQNALKDFTLAAKASPNNPKVLHTLGFCYHKMRRLQDAVSSYTEALRIDPFFIEAYIARGNALMDFGEKDATRLGRYDFLKALHINPLCLPARVNLAYNLQVENRFQQSWNQFTNALAINKDCQAALEGRAIINLQMSNTFGAFVDMNECIKISKTAELLTNRGVVHQFMGDGVNAMHDYQAAIKLDPCYSLAYYNAGNLYFKQRQFKQALTYFEKASSWDPQDESAILNAAITKVLLKQFKEALGDFQKAIDLSPYSAHIYFNRGNLYALLGQYESAENDYTHALHLHPGDALTYKRRADVRGRLSKREEAIEDYKKAIVIQTSLRRN